MPFCPFCIYHIFSVNFRLSYPYLHRAVFLRLHKNPDTLIFQIRNRLDPAYIRLRNFLHPDSLPYSALSRIEHPAPVQFLLSPGMVRRLTQIFHSNKQFIHSILYQIRDFYFKREISSCVRHSPFPIDVHHTGLIHCPEMQEQSF